MQPRGLLCGTCSPVVSGVAGSGPFGSPGWSSGKQWRRVGSGRRAGPSALAGLIAVREAGRGAWGLYYTSQEAVRRGRSRDGSAGFGRR